MSRIADLAATYGRTMPRTRFPGPRAPQPVQLVQILRGEGRYITALQERYGDTFQIKLERRPWQVFADPDDIRAVFTAPPTVAHAGDANEILRTTLGPHSILVVDEDEHLRQRRLLLPQFHGDKLATWQAAMERAAEQRVARMPRGGAFSLRPHMTAIALKVILEVVLGVRDREEHDRLAAPIDRMLEWIGRPRNILLPTLLGPDHRLVVRVHRPVIGPVDDAMYRLIAERRAATDLERRDDILSLLMLARDEQGVGMTDAEIRDEIVTLIVAGHETTATALSWAFERLTRDPERLEQLELEASAGTSSAYAEAVFREALRLRPVLNNVLRTLQEPYEIGGVTYPTGTVLAPSIFLVHRNADVYPEPLEFRPERWLDTKPGTYTWIPFGGGMRRCIGAQFAQMEMQVVLHAIARSVHLEPVGPPEDGVPRFITSSPSRGGEVRIAARPPARAVADQALAAA